MTSMPLPININELLHGKSVEWERLEFKSGWNPLAMIQTTCAFANDFNNLGGGYIIIGIAEENGRPVLPPIGLDVGQVDAIQKEILNLGYAAIQPAYHPVTIPHAISDLKIRVPDIEVVPTEANERVILVIWVPGGQTRPYKAKLALGKGDRDFGYFIRKGSSTVRAKGTDEIELLSLAATVPFDDRFNHRAKVEDISRDLILDFLQNVGSDLTEEATTLPLVELGCHMHIVDGPKEAPFPLNVGLLFFNPEPHRFFRETQIDVVWFPSGPGGESFTEKIFRGPIPRMIHDALDYINRSFLNVTVIKHSDRAEATRVSNFPYEAIEEAVVNAVYHRSYEIREPIEIRITHEDLVVLSFPGPDRSIPMEQLSKGRAMSRRYRNRRIGEFLKELNLTEGRATGIPKILNAMSKNGSPAPEFESDDDRSYFLIRLPIHPAAHNQMALGRVIEITEEADPAKPGPISQSNATLRLISDQVQFTFSKVISKLRLSFQ